MSRQMKTWTERKGEYKWKWKRLFSYARRFPRNFFWLPLTFFFRTCEVICGFSPKFGFFSFSLCLLGSYPPSFTSQWLMVPFGHPLPPRERKLKKKEILSISLTWKLKNWHKPVLCKFSSLNLQLLCVPLPSSTSLSPWYVGERSVDKLVFRVYFHFELAHETSDAEKKQLQRSRSTHLHSAYAFNTTLLCSWIPTTT